MVAPTKTVRRSLFKKINRRGKAATCKIRKSVYGEIDTGYKFAIVCEDESVDVLVLDIIEETTRYYKVLIKAKKNYYFLIEYYGRQGNDYARIYEIDVTYGQLHMIAAKQLSIETDIPAIYFMMCPLSIYSPGYQGWSCPDLNHIAEPLNSNPDSESLSLGDSGDTDDTVCPNIDDLISKKESLGIDDETVSRLQMAKTILVTMADPYADDIRKALINIAEAVAKLDAVFLVE